MKLVAALSNRSGLRGNGRLGRFFHSLGKIAGLGCALTCVAVAGCGGSDSSDSTVVATPEPINPGSQATTPEAPGAIEMPTGADPNAVPQDAANQEGGIEMPAGTKLPEGTALPEETISDPDATPSTTDSSDATPPSDSSEVSLQYESWDGIRRFASGSGKVTVVDLWSLACEPCLKEFPGLVRLRQSHGDVVQCISVNLDYDGRKTRPPEYYEDRVKSFLADVDASGILNFISQTPSDDVFTQTDLVSIPAVLIFDQQGELAKVFVDAGETAGFNYENDVTPFVKTITQG